MEWHEYLREELARKKKGLELFSANQMAMMEVRAGQRVDTSGQTIDQLKQSIKDIEAILLAAGEPL
jgi:hypothetical protein